MPVDQYTALELLCQNAGSYPANGVRTRLFKHSLKARRDMLSEQSKDLFEADPEFPVDFFEAYDGEDFQPWECKTAIELGEHLWVNRKDPVRRHVFIQADTSRSPLDCSKDVLVLLLSFHEVLPQFLDIVVSFGKPRETLPTSHYAIFCHENFLSKQRAKDHEIPRLGRSGRQIRQCYNLWAVEKSDADDASWSFRQTAVVHTFDIEKGRAFWINIKANELMRERIRDLETSSGRSRPRPQISPHGCSSFAAALTTHLLIFQWCSENWRQFLASLEKEVHEILIKVKNAPIAEVEKSLTVDINALVGSPPESPTSLQRVATQPGARTVSRRSTGTTFNMPPKRILSGLETSLNMSPALTPMPQGSPPLQSDQAGSAGRDPFGVLKEFSVTSLQRLGGIASKLQQAALILKSDADVIGGIAVHYESLMRDAEFPEELKAGCRGEMIIFREQAECYIRSLDMERAHVATLAATLEDGKRLFDTVLQFRNMEINKVFTVKAQETASRMEKMTEEMHRSTLNMESLTSDMGLIAEKTERETASMHIITLVTLIFLPGTFVATLFGSGLFQWDQNHPELPFPLWKQEYFVLFAEICIPLTVGVIVVCYIFYAWSKRRGQQKRTDVEMQVPQDEVKAGVSLL